MAADNREQKQGYVQKLPKIDTERGCKMSEIVDMSQIPVITRKGSRIIQYEEVQNMPIGKGIEIDFTGYKLFHCAKKYLIYPELKVFKRGGKCFLMHVGPEEQK